MAFCELQNSPCAMRTCMRIVSLSRVDDSLGITEGGQLVSPLHGMTPRPLPRPHSPGITVDPPGERFVLPPRPESATAARLLVTHWLGQWGIPETVRETARLLISELVANAVLHTDSQRVICRVEASGRGLRIEVADQGPGLTEAPRLADEDEESGRGLLLLDALADAWGIITPDQGAGCTVWAEIRLRPGV